MQDIRKKSSNSRSNYPISRDTHPRQDSSISHISLSGTEMRRPRYTRSDDVSVYKKREQDSSLDERFDEFESAPQRKEPRDNARTLRKIKSIFSYSFLLVILFGIYYSLTYVFDKATVTIVPNYKDITLTNEAFTIGSSNIPFTISSAEATKTKTLPKTETTTVNKKATGEIVIYNNYSNKPQQLIKLTRFEASNKKIYKIQNSVTIPGKVGDVPGELRVKVVAENEGGDYNITSDTFTIPAFKGKEQYSKLTAKSATPIIGGTTGSRAIVALTDLNAAKDEIAISLRDIIRKDFEAKNYDGDIPLYETLSVTITDNSDEILRGEADTYSAKAVGQIAVVHESDFAKMALGGDVNKSLSYRVLSGKNISILESSQNDPDSLTATSTLPLTVSGNIRVIWNTNYENLKKDLVGKTRKDFTKRISDDKTISSATVSIFPPWKSDFPARENSINVKEKLPDFKL